MAYTNNVPQGNQQIATTQPLIQANFGYIQTDAQVEHIFNGNTGPLAVTQAEGTHIQASMPNQNLLAGLPSGTDGAYYVHAGAPYFYDGTSNYKLTQNVYAAGSNTVAAGTPFQILASGAYMGIVSAFQNTSPFRYQLLQFWMSGATLVSNEMASGGTSNITLQLDGSNNLQILNGSGSSQTIKWQIFYNGAP